MKNEEMEKLMFKDDNAFAELVGAILADFAVSVDGRIAHKTYFNEQLGKAESRIIDLRAKEREKE